jgi:hypothetical protein
VLHPLPPRLSPCGWLCPNGGGAVMVERWKPDRDEAEFIGQVMAIDAGLAGHITDLLRQGRPLRSVRATLEDALKIAGIVRGGGK